MSFLVYSFVREVLYMFLRVINIIGGRFEGKFDGK